MRRGFTGKTLVWLLLLLLAVGMMAAGCASSDDAGDVSSSDTPTIGGRFVCATSGDPSNFSPILYSDTTSGLISDLVYEPLLSYNDKMALVNKLAESYEVSDDGLEWTFHLRQDVRFHDGEELTSEDVKFTYEAFLHPLYQGSRASNFVDLRGAQEYRDRLAELKGEYLNEDGEFASDAAKESYQAEALVEFENWRQTSKAIEATDDYTVVFRLEQQYVSFLNNMTYGIIPAHQFNGNLADAGSMNHPYGTENPIGAGRFKFVKWETGDYIEVERNPDYWTEGDEPYIGSFVVKILDDMNAITLALEAGEIDYGIIEPSEFERFSNLEHVKVYEFEDMGYTFMAYNQNNPLFQDKLVRQAITHAIDRQGIVDQILHGHGSVAHTHGAKIRWDYNPDVPIFEHDPAKAAGLLAEAGWADSDNDGWLDKDGQTFEFVLSTNQGNNQRIDSTVIIQQQLKEVGIKVEPRSVEWSTFVSDLLSQNYEASILGWALSPDPDSTSIWHTEGGPLNFTGFANERVDELLEQGRITADQENRAQIYQEMQKILAEEQPYTFLFFKNRLIGISKRIHGPVAPCAVDNYYQIEKWFIPEDMRKTGD